MKKERSKKYRRVRALRVLTQSFFFGLFGYLLLVSHYTGEDYLGKPVDAFFRFDPLIALTTLVAGRVVLTWMPIAAAVLVLTLVLGRFVCGWICPLGSLHQAFSFIFKKAGLLKPKREETASTGWKYLVLAVVLVGSAFALNLAGWLDPLSFLVRSFTTAVLPAAALGLSQVVRLLYAIPFPALAQPLSQFINNLAVNTVFFQAFAVGLLFLGALLLNIRKERFWCRYLCPAGALLGLAARWNVLKLRIDEDACIKCGLCTQHCQTQAEPYPNPKWRSSECVYCATCAAICPTAAIGFPASPKPEPVKTIDVRKRRVVLASLVGLAAAPLVRVAPAAKRAHVKLIRPPGALPEPEFLARCVKCGECMKACPTNGLQPTLFEAGLEGLWTPRLVPTIGYCEYYCSLCTQVCPTDAIRELTIEDKVQVKIGTSWINKNRCIPYALGKPCIVCEEHCPTSPKAIKLVLVQAALPDGTVSTQKAPVIDQDLCIGCGICENKCPVVDEPAIFVTSIGEQRSETNRLLLPVIGDGE
ncbi:MAG: 4Fe-4S binding protein [Candidatus Aminicenantes bacterium]|nr:4Fe-4S binding protein [Candidatus Aminicenantes bacterium]